MCSEIPKDIVIIPMFSPALLQSLMRFAMKYTARCIVDFIIAN